MRRALLVSLSGAVLAMSLAGCTSTPTTPSRSESVPSVAAALTKNPDLAPIFTDLTQKPFTADGTGTQTIHYGPAANTKSVSYFVSCAGHSKFSFAVFAKGARISGGAGGDCEGANLAGYGEALTGNARPTTIKVTVNEGTAFELTAYPSTEPIKN